MLKKLIRSRFLLIGCIIIATVLMGMVRAPQANPLVIEFNEKWQCLPFRLRAGLEAVHAKVNTLLENNELLDAAKALKNINLGNLKTTIFATDFGNLNGEAAIEIFLSTFINNLELQAGVTESQSTPVAQPPAPPSTTPTQPIEVDSAMLIQEFAEALEKIPQEGPNNIQLRQALQPIAKMVQEQKPNLNNILKALQEIQEGPLKDQMFKIANDPDPLPGAVFISNILGDFIGRIEFEFKSSQPHILGQPFGLANLGNTCFMNSAIQALASLDRLTNVLLNLPADYYKPNSISANYIQLLNMMQTQKTAVINPLPFCLLIWEEFFPGEAKRQQDASEFIIKLLNRLAEGEDFNPAINKDRINNDVISLLQIKSRRRVIDENGTVTKDTKDKPNIDLMLNAVIMPETRTTLLDCLRSLFTIESPEGSSSHTFSKIMEVSNYFLVRLGRETKARTKNRAPISFPLDNLNISILADRGIKLPFYRCKAFIVHIGAEITGGHYVAYVRMGNDWYLCNDTEVEPNKANVVKEFAENGLTDSAPGTPVMFFYEQQ